MRAALLICYPPKAMIGLRHVVEAGEKRALCGMKVEEWYCEVKPFDPKTIECKRCKAAHSRRVPESR